jgi:DNA-binding NarL/FixJ family response regulator
MKKTYTDYSGLKEKYDLTNNEIEICRLIQEKLSNKEISVKLNKAESTIKNSIQIIFEKLGVNKREKVIDLLTNFK